MNGNYGLYVPLTTFRDTVHRARNIRFSVKAQRDQALEQLHNLSFYAVDYATAPNGYLVDVFTGILADLLQDVIINLDFGERSAGLLFVKGCSQILRIIANPNSGTAGTNGLILKTPAAP